MFQSFLYVPIVAQELPFDIFEKYRMGMQGQDLPFRLYSLQEQSFPADTHRPPQPRSNTRGPYRRYSREEKQSIILRMLQGATMKKIAEQSGIPKRNLIRWKHEFLHSKSIFARRKSASTVDESKSRRDPEWIETKESISEGEERQLA